jgi:DNA-binding NarL/FixJ family response regulator
MPDARNFTRVMLADDHAIVREGYRALLQKQDRLQVVAEAGNGADAYRVYKEAKPDLVIMDVSMPGIGGVEAIRRIRQWDNSARILVFTMHQSAAYAVQAIKAGARGFVTKSSPPEALLRAIVEVMAGRIALSPDIDHELAINRRAEPTGIRNPAHVAGREIRRGDRRDLAYQRQNGSQHALFDPRQTRRRVRHRTGAPRASPADHRSGRYRELGEREHILAPPSSPRTPGPLA